MRTLASLFVMAAVIAGIEPAAIRAQDTQKPVFQRAPDALERVTWRTRTLVSDDRLTNWNFALPSTGVAAPTFLEAVVRADAAVVNLIEASSGQRVSPQVQKNLDFNLTAAEIADLKSRMGEIRVVSYRVDALPGDVDVRRKVLAFVKALGAETLVVPASTNLADLDTLADEYGINVAVGGDAATAARIAKSLEGRSKRIGVGLDATADRAALARVGSRLSYIALGRPALNADFFHELSRLNIRPLVLTLDTAGVVKAPGDLFRAVETFETAVQPAYGAHFTVFSRDVPIRRDLARPARGETPSEAELAKRSAEVLQKIRAAIPAKPYAAPKNPRKLLVVESLQGMSHDTIPHANVMLEEMGKITGAFTTEFNNDLNNLKYPKVKEYDAVFLNSIVGEFAADLDVRDGLARYVREGGGLGGVHGTPWASRNWDEFAEMIGSQSAPHRIEQGIMKVYDAASPIMKPFGGKDLPFREEYYRFEHEGRGRLRWDKVRVLMTVALDDPKIEPRPWNGYKRPDNVYPVTWIRSYGQGRVFYSSLGHMPETFWTPELVGHFLAGVQFMLGDLDADTTPNPRGSTTSSGAAMQQAPTGSGGALAPPAPAVPSISQRPTGSSLGTIRVGASDNNTWFGWRVAMPSVAIKGLTLSEALAKADGYPIGVTSVVVTNTQIVSAEVPKPLDYRLQPGERSAVNYRLRELNLQILGYLVQNLGADASTRRRVFEFAKSINVPVIITNDTVPLFAELDALAEEFGINVAFLSSSNPKSLVTALEGRSKRLGIAADLEGWMASGLKPADALPIVKERLLFVRACDRSAIGPSGRIVPIGEGAGELAEFFLSAYRAGIKPLSIVIAGSVGTEADYMKDINGFERVMWPAMAERVRAMVASPAGQIRGPDRLKPEDRQQIEAAAPRQALVKPKQPRKLLVTDIQMYSGHSTIPHGNLLLELMAKNTSAFEPVFSNDLNLLKYPAIKQFDAIYLNNVCGMVYNDPEVRDGILRFVREGGGIGGHHAVTFANNHWPEFAEMMGGWAGAHHIEKQMVKIDDATSPLTKSFGSASFEHTDEFYIFPPSSPYSREKQHILLSIDVEKSDRATANRFCAQCTRPDQDYGLAWIRTYGQGRTYFTPLGHTNIFYTDKRWTEHLLAALQYILGDLDANATPSARKGTQN
jgi:type 1 glutamine amidotransferase/sugar phosphate isomerase/epimerase